MLPAGSTITLQAMTRDGEPPKFIEQPLTPIGVSMRSILDQPDPTEDPKLLALVVERGRLITPQLTAQLLWFHGMQSLPKIQRALEVAEQLLKDAKLEETKISAGRMLAEVAKGFSTTVDKVMALAEKASQRPASGPKRNLPPQVNLQVNVAPPANNQQVSATVTKIENPSRDSPL